MSVGLGVSAACLPCDVCLEPRPGLQHWSFAQSGRGPSPRRPHSGPLHRGKWGMLMNTEVDDHADNFTEISLTPDHQCLPRVWTVQIVPHVGPGFLHSAPLFCTILSHQPAAHYTSQQRLLEPGHRSGGPGLALQTGLQSFPQTVGKEWIEWWGGLGRL